MNVKGYGYRDRYTYADSDVLINKLGLRSPEELERAERAYFRLRSATAPDDLPLETDAFLALHQHLFQDVYAWAGELRDADLSKGATRFCVPQFIRPELDKRFEHMRADARLDRERPRDLAAALAEHTIELNMIHPFREGNGRTLRAYLIGLAAQRGQRLDFMKVRPDDWMEACIQGVAGETQPMAKVLERALTRPTEQPDPDRPKQRRQRKQGQ